MKIRVEQILLEEHILVYSKYIKDTESGDEDGADFEYDFDTFISNVDDIQQAILRLYGEFGLLRVIKHYAEGAEEVVTFDPIEYEEGSSLLSRIRNLQRKEMSSKEDELNSFSSKEPTFNKPQIPTDDIYIFNGWLEALANNDDLNVLKMVGDSVENISDELMSSVTSYLKSSYPELNIDQAKFHAFEKVGKKVVFISLPKSIIVLNFSESEERLLFPQNEFQERQVALFEKFMMIENTIRLKNSVILEVKIKNEAYYLLFNILSSRFESKKKILKK